MSCKHNILYITSKDASSNYWENILGLTIAPFGNLVIENDDKSFSKLLYEDIDLIIYDTEDAYNVQNILEILKDMKVTLPIIVACDVWTWKRARDAFRLGASDCIQKSFDKNELQKQILSILKIS